MKFTSGSISHMKKTLQAGKGHGYPWTIACEGRRTAVSSAPSWKVQLACVRTGGGVVASWGM
eukprot:748470-Hanusia_phi.AAC.6